MLVVDTRRADARAAFLFVCAALGAALVVALVSGCQGEPLQALRPKIQIASPDAPGDAAASICATELVRDCAFHFGEVALGQTRTLSFAIENPARADLSVESLTLDGGDAATGAFTVDVVGPQSIAGGASVVVTVRYTPATTGAHAARLIIASDADNVLPGSDVVIELTGSGVELAGPTIVVAPAACDFGGVGVGVRALCTLSVENAGPVALHVESASFSDDTAAGVFDGDGAGRTALEGATIQPGTATSATFSATPTALGIATGTLRIASDDRERSVVEVPFTVRGAASPTAIARLKSVNGTDTAGNASPPIEPLDDVVLSGDQSVGAGGTSIASYAWTIIEKPPESSVELTNATGVDTSFVFSSASGDVFGVDVAGTFRVQLVVTDTSGAVSENEAIVTLNSVPTDGIHVQLTWGTAGNDLDLHFGRGFNVNWCSNNDCHYGNCEGGGPNWDGVAGFTTGDPSLDIDDLTGFGPENVNIDAPIDNRYVIAVHAYDGNGGEPGFEYSTATVKVFIDGALVGTYLHDFEDKDDFWRVAEINVTNGAASVSEIDTLQFNTPAGCE